MARFSASAAGGSFSFSGEGTSGRTDSVLKSLAVYYETQDRLEKRLKSAVLYPAVLIPLLRQ